MTGKMKRVGGKNGGRGKEEEGGKYTGTGAGQSHAKRSRKSQFEAIILSLLGMIGRQRSQWDIPLVTYIPGTRIPLSCERMSFSRRTWHDGTDF